MPVDAAGLEATLLHLLRTPSYAGEETEVAGYVAGRLAELGCRVERDDAGSTFGGACGNVIARLPGTTDAEPIFFNAHLDTVGRTEGLEPVNRDGVLYTSGATVLGGDDEAGVTAILEGLAAAVRAGGARPPLEIVFTVGEETGLHGARALDLGRLESRIGFVFDGGQPIGRMTLSAPTQASFVFELHGRAAHAGVEPEKGVNAIACAAAAISRVRQGRIDAETTANVGVIQGGTATNIVCEHCLVKAEARSRDPEKLEAQWRHMVETFEAAAAEHGCRLTVQAHEVYRGFRIDRDEPVARLAAAGVRATGYEPSAEDGGGGSDANIFNAGGLRCVILACGHEAVHTPQEHLAIADVVAAAEVVTGIIACAAEETA
ncbi:MAG: M20/M25/M40 family metallo-hydrolase [Armatimonadetes bacterium]|nr:M20/M25/M40 family metallo-hydrolase [Armatimonadota bacterium]